MAAHAAAARPMAPPQSDQPKSAALRILMPAVHIVPPADSEAPTEVGMRWFGLPVRFHVVDASLEVDGYQMYAVEKWIVERTRAVTTLTVYTGHPAHKITVAALEPIPSLSPTDALAEYETALRHLRHDGARPKSTPYGTLLPTSLARFRSDHTIVPLPRSFAPPERAQLYTNIDLLRVGCGGRSAVTLEESSETTKDRFLSMYHLPDVTSTLNTAALTKSHSHSTSKSHSHSHSHSPGQHIKSPALEIVRPKHSRTSNSFSHPASTSPLSQTNPHSSPGSPTSTYKREAQFPFSGGSSSVSNNTRDPAKEKEKDPTVFNTAVLELVKLVQAALAVCGLFPLGDAIDGLLCDVTVEGLERWAAEAGEVEPMERIADPAIVSALLSLVLSTRNKLAALGYSHVVPKDPFLQPEAFTAALSQYVQNTSPTLPHSRTPHLHHHSPQPPFRTPATGNGNSASTSISGAGKTFLTRALVESINAAYDKKGRQGDSRKVHRVLLSKLDDFTTDLRGDGSDSDAAEGKGKDAADGGHHDNGGSGARSGIGSLASGLGLGGSGGGPGAVWEVTTDLGTFVKVVLGKEKDKDGVGVAGSVRALWSGRIGVILRMREKRVEHEKSVLSPGNALRRRDRGGSKAELERMSLGAGLGSDGDTGDVGSGGGEKTDGTEDDEIGKPWSGRVQKKIEAWAGLSRKKQGNDLAARSARWPASHDSIATGPNAIQLQSPPLVAIPDDDDILSSGQASPIGGTPTGLMLHSQSAVNTAFNQNLDPTTPLVSDYDKRVTAFNQKRPPWGKGIYTSRVSSWSDPVSAREQIEGLDEDGGVESSTGRKGKKHEKSRLGYVSSVEGGNASSRDDISVHSSEGHSHRRRVRDAGSRRHSFHHIEPFKDMRPIAPDHLRIDVELCGQLLVMRRREQHLEGVLACLQALTSSLSLTNATLREDLRTHQPALAALDQQTEVLAQIETERAKADMTKQETNVLLYESDQFGVPALWRTAGPPRRSVYALRDKVFGTGGRRLPTGVHGAHGRFNRVQWTLDGQERLVDFMGRTEEEAAEESGVEEWEGGTDEETDQDEPVQHPAYKPVWLLRFFTSLGTGWRSSKENGKPKGDVTETETEAEVASPGLSLRENSHVLTGRAGFATSP